MVLAWAVPGAAVALLLAAFMNLLIHSSEMRLSDAQHVQMLDFVRLKRDESVERREHKPERPQLDRTPDTPPELDQASASGDTLAVSAPLMAPGEGDLDVGRSGLGTGDGEYLPIVKVAPIYPRRALERGLTGHCMVRYTVTTAGTVKDVAVVAEECSDQIFQRPSIEAARRFKYKPRVIDGEAVEVIGVYNNFLYENEPEGRGEGSR